MNAQWGLDEWINEWMIAYRPHRIVRYRISVMISQLVSVTFIRHCINIPCVISCKYGLVLCNNSGTVRIISFNWKSSKWLFTCRNVIFLNHESAAFFLSNQIYFHLPCVFKNVKITLAHAHIARLWVSHYQYLYPTLNCEYLPLSLILVSYPYPKLYFFLIDNLIAHSAP